MRGTAKSGASPVLTRYWRVRRRWGLTPAVLAGLTLILSGCARRFEPASCTCVEPSRGVIAPTEAPPLEEERERLPRRRVRVLTADGIPLRGVHIRVEPSRMRGHASWWEREMPSEVSHLDVPVDWDGAVRASLQRDFTLDCVVQCDLERPGHATALLEDASIVTGVFQHADGMPFPGCPVILHLTSRDANEPRVRTIVHPTQGRGLLPPRVGRPAHLGPDVRERLWAVTDARGRFAFAGLEEDFKYTLSYPSTLGTWASSRTPVRRGDKLQLSVDTARVVVHLVDASTGTAIPRGGDVLEVQWTHLEQEPVDPLDRVGWPPEVDPLTVLGPQGSRWEVVIKLSGYETKRMRLTLPEPGSRHTEVRLQPACPR